MEYEAKRREKLDLQPVVRSFLSIARHLWVLCLVLVIGCSSVLAVRQKRS